MGRMRARFLLPLLAAFAVSCAGEPELVAEPAFAPAADWRATATEDDRRRLREWRDAWTEALAEARAAGYGARLAAAETLLDPDAALLEPAPPTGNYRCRTVKLGTKGEVGLAYVDYPWFRCRVLEEGGSLRLVKVSGSQRPIGQLFAAGPRRMVFLGTLQLGDETLALQYGRDRERNLAGILHRIGERRWRLAFPYPHFESKLDVIELVPADS